MAALTWPAVITNITTPLLGLCDIAIAGHRGGASFIAALAVATSMFNMIYWLMGFLRMGTSGLTARAYGAGSERESALTLWRALTLGAAIGLAITALQRPIADLLLQAMDITGEARAEALRYFSITVWGAPAVMATCALTGWYIGMQNSRIPMLMSLLADVVNIAASVGLVFGLGMDIAGVATGTLIAQWVWMGGALTIALRRYRPRWPGLKAITEGSGLSRFFRINGDIFLRTLCMVGVTLWFTRTGASGGETMLAVNALLMQLFTLFSFVMDGLAFSGEALTGRYCGASDRMMLRLTVRCEIRAGALMALLFTGVYAVGAGMLLSVLTDDPAVLAASRPYVPLAVLLPAAGFLAFTYDGIFIGATATRQMVVSVGVASALFFLLSYCLGPSLGNHGLWIAFLSYLAVRGLILAALAPRAILKR